MNEDLLKSGEVAVLFGVGVKTVDRWAREGLLRAIRTPGGSYRFPASDVWEALSGRQGSGTEESR